MKHWRDSWFGLAELVLNSSCLKWRERWQCHLTEFAVSYVADTGRVGGLGGGETAQKRLQLAQALLVRRQQRCCSVLRQSQRGTETTISLLC